MKVLMVCLGNICRSPMAQGILEHRVRSLSLGWEVDSAGTSGWHDGEEPDSRAIEICQKYGIDISNQRSRKFRQSDFDYYDLILTMDNTNHQNITRLTNNKYHIDKVKPVLSFHSDDVNEEVPDPYYDNNFEEVFLLLDESIDGLIQSVLRPHSGSEDILAV